VSGQDVSERNQGIALFQEGKNNDAVSVLTKVVETDKKSRLAKIYLAASLLKLGKTSEARKIFYRANFITKESPFVYDKELTIIGRKPLAGYTDEARRQLVQGTINVAVEFLADGKIGFVFPINELPYGLTENAVQAAQGIRFEPAVKEGKAVPVVRILTYSFEVY
jgi:tetratricopeptide (TPR) repeat protein